MTAGNDGGTSTDDPHVVLVRLGLDDRQDLLEQRRDLHRLEPQILRPRELQEPLHHLIQPPDLALDDGDVLERALDGCRQRTGAAPGPSPSIPPAAAPAPAAAAASAPRIFVRSSSR